LRGEDHDFDSKTWRVTCVWLFLASPYRVRRVAEPSPFDAYRDGFSGGGGAGWQTSRRSGIQQCQTIDPAAVASTTRRQAEIADRW